MRINRRLLLLVATCVVLLPTATPVQAASCKGKSHDMSLSAGSVAPGVGTTSTAFRFSTVYTDNAGCPPVSITVTVSGVGTFPLSATGTMTSGGEVYARSMSLPAGRRTYFFAATSGEGAAEVSFQLPTVNPVEVVITAPTPAPTPTPLPRPATTAPTPPPATPTPATPAPTPTPATPAPTPRPATPAPTPAAAAPTATPPGDEGGGGAPIPSVEPQPSESAPMPEPTTSPVTGGVPILPGNGEESSTGPGGGGPWAALVVGLAGIGIVFLFAIRGRRDDESGAMATATIAASTSADEIPAVTPLPPMRDLVPPVDPHLLDEGGDGPPPRADEAGVPRWLRPSVREARFRDDRSYSPRLDHWN